jgi:hypothetical protein
MGEAGLRFLRAECLEAYANLNIERGRLNRVYVWTNPRNPPTALVFALRARYVIPHI